MTPDVQPQKAETGKRPLYKNPWLWTFLAGAVLLAVVRPLFRNEPPPPPVLWELPAFSLIDQQGKAVSKETLRGQVYVAFFFFSHCQSICPRLLKSVVALQGRYEQWKNKDIKLIGFSVDPENDRPAKLAAFLRKYGGKPSRISLLTSADGKDAPLRELIIKGFKSHVGKREKKATMVDIAHSGKVALVDGQGRVRGYFDTNARGLDEAFHRSLHVWMEGRRR
jgi:protein SCO1/2